MLFRLSLLLGVLCYAAVGGAQTTQPASDARLELRANQAFNRGEYNTALPLLKRLADEAKDQPSRVGPIQEKIRVCEKALASLKAAAPVDPKSSAAVAQRLMGDEVPTASETRKKHPAPKPGEVLETTIKELGNFDYDQERGGGIPEDVKRLSGSKLRVRGFMIPMDQADKITQFALVPSLFACCYGQPPQIQHTIVVNCPKGKSVSYCPDEIVVEGELKVQEKKDDDYVVSLFEVTAASVKPAPKQ